MIDYGYCNADLWFYCSEKMVRIITRDGSLGEPPPQMMESFIDVELWFIPEYPQFLR